MFFKITIGKTIECLCLRNFPFLSVNFTNFWQTEYVIYRWATFCDFSKWEELLNIWSSITFVYRGKYSFNKKSDDVRLVFFISKFCFQKIFSLVYIKVQSFHDTLYICLWGYNMVNIRRMMSRMSPLFNYIGYRVETQVTSFACKSLYIISHLTHSRFAHFNVLESFATVIQNWGNLGIVW